MTRPITFLSDYGLADEFVGVVHGVIAGICPDARVIDLTHGIPRQDVRAGRDDARAGAAVHARRACTWRSSTPTSAPSGGRWRCGRPRRAACWSVPTTAC